MQQHGEHEEDQPDPVIHRHRLSQLQFALPVLLLTLNQSLILLVDFGTLVFLTLVQGTQLGQLPPLLVQLNASKELLVLDLIMKKQHRVLEELPTKRYGIRKIVQIMPLPSVILLLRVRPPDELDFSPKTPSVQGHILKVIITAVSLHLNQIRPLKAMKVRHPTPPMVVTRGFVGTCLRHYGFIDIVLPKKLLPNVLQSSGLLSKFQNFLRIIT